MANERLGAKNVEVLLNQYRSERKRLIFQLARIRETIEQLRSIRTKEGREKPSLEVRRGPGRPRKIVPQDEEGSPAARGGDAGASAKRGRKKRARSGGYRLSPWDEMVVEAITKEGLLPKEVIVQRARVWARTNARKMSAAELETKVTRVLQKLSGRRGVLGTHRSGLRRGYHYGLKEWFFASTGALRKQHLGKLVVGPKD